MRIAALAPLLLAAACAGGGEPPPWDPLLEERFREEGVPAVELSITGHLGAVDLAERSFLAAPAFGIRYAGYTQLSAHSTDALPNVHITVHLAEVEPGVTSGSIESCLTRSEEPGVCYRAQDTGLTHRVTTGTDGDELALHAAWHDGSEITLTARYTEITIPP
jgi:hypothetical protein